MHIYIGMKNEREREREGGQCHLMRSTLAVYSL